MSSTHGELAIESLEVRSVLSTVAFGDFNNDGLVDVAAITNPNTITVSLANPDGSYSISAKLSTPKTLPIKDISVVDRDGDGELDIISATAKPTTWYFHSWQGNGDGTFGSLVTERWKPPKNGF